MKTGLWHWIRCWLLHRRFLHRECHDPTTGFGSWHCRKCHSRWHETNLLTAKRDYGAEYAKFREFAVGQFYDRNLNRVATVSVTKKEFRAYLPPLVGSTTIGPPT